MFSGLLQAIFKKSQHEGVRKVTCRVVLALSGKLNRLSSFDLMETLQHLLIDYGNKTTLNVFPTRRNDIMKGIEQYIKGYAETEAVAVAEDTSIEDITISALKFDGDLCQEEIRKTCTINKDGFLISALLSIEYDSIFSIVVKNSSTINIEMKAPIKNSKTDEKLIYTTVGFKTKSKINIDRAGNKLTIVNGIDKESPQKRKRFESSIGITNSSKRNLRLDCKNYSKNNTSSTANC